MEAPIVSESVGAGPAEFEVPLRKRLGAYYTPEPVARLLVRWALRGRPGRILDPSFGGCNFLRTAVDVLDELGAVQPGTLVYGVDIDPNALAFAQELIASGTPRDNFVIDDFFHVEPSRSEEMLFHALVGNPPYIRHHWLQDQMRSHAVKAARRAEVTLNLRADAWAYFVVHSMRFLKPGGRLAFLLPGALLQAQYAAPVLRALEERFANVRTIRVMERLFPDAQEETVVLLASGFGEGTCRRRFDRVSTVEELQRLLDGTDAGTANVAKAEVAWREVGISDLARSLWQELQHQPDVFTLGSLATLRIGTVTGANKFFVRSAAEKERLENARVHFVPIVSRSGWLKSLRWTKFDQSSVDQTTAVSQLLCIEARATLTDELARLIAEAECQGLHERRKCALRAPWYSLVDRAVPDAFLPYMGHNAPRLILNHAGATCTNAIHRIWWKETEMPKECFAIGSWTTLFTLGAELLGRSYGGGVLKLEPRAAARVPIPVVLGSEHCFHELDRLVRRGEITEATALADHVVLRECLGLERTEIAALREAAGELAWQRLGIRNGS